jgi:hypothetical protein
MNTDTQTEQTQGAGSAPTLKIFALDDWEWWAGYDIDSVLQEAREQCGPDAFPGGEDDAYEVSGTQLDLLYYSDEGEPPITFRQQLEKIAPTFTYPCFFASTEA